MFALLIVAALLGAFVGSITSQFEAIIRGILGLAVICLIFLYTSSSMVDGSIDTRVLHPKIRYFILAFIWSALSYWATNQIYDAILFLAKR